MNKPIEAIYPLSPTQEGILFHALYAPHSGVYFQHLSYTLRGRLDEAAFKLAWERIVERHAVLRTAFNWERRTQALQIVHKQVPLAWESLDWCAHPAAEQQARLDAFLYADRAQGFRLDRPPLSRFALIRFAPDTYQFVWSFHHLLLDGWSLALVLKEVMALCAALAAGQDLRLEPVRPYREYVAWLNRPDAVSSEAFWKDWLKGFTAPTALGIDRAPGSLPSQEAVYAEVHLQLPTATTETLRAIAREHQLTLNTLVQGVWALLVSRYSETEDVVFGATVSGRTSALTGMDSMVGLFINSLPVRVQVTPSHFLPWLKALQARQFELQQHQHTPLVQIQGWSELPHGKTLFDSILVFENYPVDDSLKALWQQGGSLEVSDIYPSPERTNYPLSVTAFLGTQLEMRIFYECHRFSSASVARLAGHLQTLFTAVATNPHRPLARLPMLSEPELAERRLWNRTATDYPPPVCLHRQVEAQVARTPGATAVRFETQKLTYRELNHRANQLAYHLQSLGVGPEVPVGICLPRSLELIVALLAVLKAGGAYVPLDPSYPPDRLAFMVADSQMQVLLTASGVTLPFAAPQTVTVDQLPGHYSIDNLPVPVDGDNLAYLIYTSGSTGRPKGAMNTHRAVVNRLLWMQATYPLTAQDRVLHKTPISFDVSGWELFWPLLAGAELVIAPPEIHKDSAALVQLIAEAQITTLHFVPAMLAVFLDEAGLRAGPLRRVFCSGEALPYALQERFFERLGGVELHNLYGPTEAAIDVSHWACTPQSLSVPIGRPIANVELWVLDRQLQSVPVGVAGELYIGGTGLGRGYTGRADLTAERWVPHPGATTPGARLYRTGDRARYREDGAIEYLGRLDNQVKLRGLRIELGEIEAVLAEQAGVREAAVVVQGERLVAWVVPALGNTLVPATLKGHLSQKLPGFMVPGVIALRADLPLGPSGKVDRKALACLPISPELEVGIAARTPLEAQVMEIWGQLLPAEQIGIHDDFFALGGHSLIATRLISRVREVFQVDLPLRTIFEGASTVAQMARTLEQLEFERADPEVLAKALRELEQLSDEEVLMLMHEDAA